jgi:3-hydroxyisobutyrate dehydrogenase
MNCVPAWIAAPLNFTKNICMMKAFLGMGLLGSNFVKAMLQKGDAVQVWNRTASKAKALEQYGASAFDNVEDAVDGADIIHVTLKDDATVDEVLRTAAKGFKQGAVIIDHTTTSVKGGSTKNSLLEEQRSYLPACACFYGPAECIGKYRFYDSFRRSGYH